MFSALPDLTPRDSHSLWYIPSHDTYPGAGPGHHNQDASNAALAPHQRRPPGGPQAAGGAAGAHLNGGGGSAAVERSALARLLGDEQYMERRRQNVRNFGSGWLRPPGVAKTLFQMREERREAEEHAEAMRREHLAQQLAEAAEAEAEAAAAAAAGEGGSVGMDEDMAGLEGEGVRDLDDEIPEADDFGFDGADSDEEEDDDDDDDDDDSGDSGEDEAEDDDADAGGGAAQARREMRNQVRSMRATEDRVRAIMARGPVGVGVGGEADVYGAVDDIDDEDRAQMLEEEDLVHEGGGVADGDGDGDDDEPGTDMDMGADLDDDIPEAESGLYEHTDTEAELSSSDDDDATGARDVGHAAAAAAPAHQPPQMAARLRRSRQRASLQSGRGSLARSEVDISSILSRDGSSVAGSSPHVRRRNQ